MADVPTSMILPASADCKVAKPASSLRVATSAGLGANHIIGHLLGGLRHISMVGNEPSDDTGTARIYSYRHPDCDYVDIVGRFGGEASQTTWSIVGQAGTGTAQTYSDGTGVVVSGRQFRLRCPWDSSDAGYQPITVAYTDVSLQSLMIFDVPRESLGTGDNRVELYDADYTRIGLGAEQIIAVSDTAGPSGITKEIIDAWAAYYPQVMSWWTPTSAALTTSALSLFGPGGASDFFGGVTFRHRARQKRDADTVQDSKWYLYAMSSAHEYTLYVSSANASDAIIKPGLTNNSYAWVEFNQLLEIAADEDEEITIEGRIDRPDDAGSNYIYLAAVSGIEIPG